MFAGAGSMEKNFDEEMFVESQNTSENHNNETKSQNISENNEVEQSLDAAEGHRQSPDTEKLLNAVVQNENEAYEQYCLYAHHIGFTVRKEHSGFWPNSKKLKTKDFVCGKAGFKKELKDTITVRFKRADTRTGCPAMIRYFVDLDGNWSVKKFVESHNHPLAEDGDKHLLRSSRKMCDINADILRTMTKSGIRTSDAFRFLANEVGGVENLDCTKRDAYNFIQRERRVQIELGDANSLIQLFTTRQADDPMFAWDFQIDEAGCLVNFLWCDGMSRIDYDCFGDMKQLNHSSGYSELLSV
ncbi:protein FAR1-RELATED SEQUENCE 5-like [Phalaenopsis equestris]|uniref:protein FAR1-RELATED SEQUENCE 5-like n=1 Tax=Phalaenopsis equestris TaxID=78828 RepID=UPI0009E1D527|nr:protein FAR1-RELATED SEQUENCE 5-like [Phalaenopsis equestris]